MSPLEGPGNTRRSLILSSGAGLAVGAVALAITGPASLVRSLFEGVGRLSTPSLTGSVTFVELQFEKYVVAVSNACDVGVSHLCKAGVYFLSGKATVSYQLDWVEFREGKDGLTPTLTNKIAIEAGLGRPRVFSVALEASPQDFITVDRNEADPITGSEAGTVGGMLGVVLGAGGGYVLGDMVSSTVGAVHFGPVGRLASWAASAKMMAIGGAAGGGSGYLLGRSLFTGLSLVDGVSQTDRESAFDKTKSLIVAELLSDDELMTELNRRALGHIDQLVRDLGLSHVKPAVIA